MSMRSFALLAVTLAGCGKAPPAAQDEWIPACDAARVRRTGAWSPHRHRYAAAEALATREEGAALDFSFRGTGLAVAFDTLTVPSYGRPERGALQVSVDGGPPLVVRPHGAANEVTLARGLPAGDHAVRIVHRLDGDGAGCRLVGFRVLPPETSDLAFTVSGDAAGELVDVRAVVTRDGRVLRDGLVRNWLTGACRLTGLPAGDGTRLEIRALGWKTARRTGFSLDPLRETTLDPLYLAREEDVPAQHFRFPSLGHPVVRRAGETFRARFHAYQARIGAVRIVRRAGPAVVSAACGFKEDPSAEYLYYKEGTVALPHVLPPGLYDLEVEVTTGRGRDQRASRRAVHVVSDFPRDPVFVSFGHLDTWGQFPGEYLARVVEMANLIGPDMVLVSNEVNPAYVSGALYRLEMPFVVTFGNHQVYGHERWFGDPVGAVDFGPDLAILNFGPTWDSDPSVLENLLAARGRVACKVINTFEPNAPVAEILDRHRVRLIHDAHGPAPKVEKLGSTPTLRVGKVDAESFRILRFKGPEPVSVTYRGHAERPIPFPRGAEAPVRARFDGPNDGTRPRVTATVANDLEEPLPGARVTFVLPHAPYRVDGGRPLVTIRSDDGKFTILTVGVDLPPRGTAAVTAIAK